MESEEEQKIEHAFSVTDKIRLLVAANAHAFFVTNRRYAIIKKIRSLCIVSEQHIAESVNRCSSIRSREFTNFFRCVGQCWAAKQLLNVAA